MREFTLEIPNEYAMLLWFLAVICIECIMVDFFIVTRKRAKVFNVDFMIKFQKEHQEHFGEKSSVVPGGFPDSGNGYYADKLPYKTWFELNTAIRVHQNFVE